MRAHLSLATKILAMQLAVVLAAVVTGGLASLWIAYRQLDTQYQERALAIAESTAAIPALHEGLAKGDRSGAIQAIAEDVRRSSGARYVVVTDRDGIRYSHPN